MPEEMPLFFSELIKREQELTDKIDEENIQNWVTVKKTDPRVKKVISLSNRGYTVKNISLWFKSRNIPFTTSTIPEIRKQARIKGEWE